MSPSLLVVEEGEGEKGEGRLRMISRRVRHLIVYSL